MLRALRRQGIKEVRAVTGLHDIVAYVEAKNHNSLGAIIVNRIETTEGVQRTVTMVTVKV